MVSCQKGPTRHAHAWQIGPFGQDTLDICIDWQLLECTGQYSSSWCCVSLRYWGISSYVNWLYNSYVQGFCELMHRNCMHNTVREGEEVCLTLTDMIYVWCYLYACTEQYLYNKQAIKMFFTTQYSFSMKRNDQFLTRLSNDLRSSHNISGWGPWFLAASVCREGFNSTINNHFASEWRSSWG